MSKEILERLRGAKLFGSTLYAEAADLIEALEARIAELEQQPTCKVDYLRANFTPFYLLSNARRIASAQTNRHANWVIAMDLFAVGSNSARAICIEAGIDPDATEVRRAAIAKEQQK